MNESELLRRIAATLKRQVGPATEEPLAKSQAFMASVVLDKVANQLDDQQARQLAHKTNLSQLADVLPSLVGDAPPQVLSEALSTFAAAPSDLTVAAVIEALYATRNDLTEAVFETLRATIRRTLRADLDRRLKVAG